MAKKVRLVNATGGFHFDEGTSRRYAERGVPFEVEEATAEILLMDSNVTYAGDTGPQLTGASEVSATPAFVSDEDLGSLKVADLRERASGAGIDSAGNKGELVERLTVFQAGFAAGRQAAYGEAVAHAVTAGDVVVPPSTSTPAPNSSESEPFAPPPPPGGLTPENEAHVRGTPPEGAQSGAITLGDLGEGGVAK